MWDFAGPGIEPMSPALAGEFLTTGPPEKSAIAFCMKRGHRGWANCWGEGKLNVDSCSSESEACEYKWIICIIVLLLFKLTWLFRSWKKSLKMGKTGVFDTLKQVFAYALEEVSFLERIGISLSVPLRCKWSMWILRNYNHLWFLRGEKKEAF